MPKIVTFKSHKINILNLVPYHLIESSIDQWYGPCRAHLDQSSGHLYSQSDILEKQTFEQFNCGLRDVQWSQHVDYLDHIASRAQSFNKSLFFGTHSEEQLNFLANMFGDDSSIFVLSYTRHDYEQLLENVAQYHVYLLVSHKLMANSVDAQQIKRPRWEAVDFYKKEFDQQQLIPCSYSDSRHYEIPYKDYTDRKKMHKHFSYLGSQDCQGGFYDRWLKLYTKDLS